MTTYGFLSTYPPTRCGLATFTAALASAMPMAGDGPSRVVRVDDQISGGDPVVGPRTVVVGDLHPGSADSRGAAAAALNACDVVIVQHEYGIYGGRDGDEILDLLARIHVPCIVVLHTVLDAPTAHQRWLLSRIAGLASTVVVMTETASTTLVRRYAVPGSRVQVIPHGAPAWRRSALTAGPHDRPTILTWGLLGPGKGIEWGIRALAKLAPADRPRYLVAGQTHPNVLAASGEAYRESLLALAASLGLDADVEIDGRYRDAQELELLVAGADLVLLPYDSREQATSGVLAEAVAAGKPVIATRFPHAVELLSDGAGILVGHEQPDEIAAAIHRALEGEAAGMASAARARSRGTSWDAVASRYRRLAVEIARLDAA